tara:strand:+ start:265 stop:468 length:204 start_codon:yes stop_codon:yes gene_type:complete
LKILLGFTILSISIEAVFNSTYILKYLTPEVLEKIEPPTIVRKRKKREKLLDEKSKEIPDVPILLKI